jgi:uncharacterized protein (TIGR02246 family)
MGGQDPDRIREVAMQLDDAMEAMDKEKVLEFFSEDCEIKFLGKTVKGKDGAKRWLDWMEAKGMTRMKLTPVNIQVIGDTFLEEFKAKAVLEDGSEIEAEQCEVLIYEDYKVKSLRLYFDRLQYAPMIAKNFVEKAVIRRLNKMTFAGLED